jgi:transmembrane sensor
MSGTRRIIEGGGEVPEAVRWFCRSVSDDGSEMTVEERTEWERWASNPNYAQELNRVKAVWQRLADVPAAGLATDTEPADDYDGEIPVSRWLAQRRRKGRTWRVSRSAKLLSIAACVVVLAASGLTLYGTRHSLWETLRDQVQWYATAASQHRTVELPDGSRITLGARTELSTHYTAARRIILLERGEAWFSVARNAQRPFTVLAGGGEITAIGTQFNVRRDLDANLDRVTVTVSNGTVDVGPPKTSNPNPAAESGSPIQPTWAPARLGQGQEISYDTQGPEGDVATADLEATAAWKEGRLEYRHVPLKVVIPRVNRYSEKPIVLADRAAGELQFSGTVFEDQVNEWLRALQAAYPIEITEGTDRIVIRYRNAVSGGQ